MFAEFKAWWFGGGWMFVHPFVVGLLTRLGKPDTKLPVDIPAKARPAFTILVGVFLAVINAVVGGMPWRPAVMQGAGLATLAIVGHYLGIDTFRQGKELALPGLMKSDAPKPPSVPPMPLFLLAVALVTGCSWFKPANSADKPPAMAVVFVTARVVDLTNHLCVSNAEKLFARADAEPDHLEAIHLAERGKALNEECRKLTTSARATLETVEKAIDAGVALSDSKVGCAVKRALDASADMCTALIGFHLIDKRPRYLDDAISFGSPLLAAVGACPLEGSS